MYKHCHIFFTSLILAAIVSAPATAAIVPVADQTTWRTETGPYFQVDFELFTGPVTSEYPGLAFSDFDNGSPTSVAQYPYEGANCLFTSGNESGGGGGWAADFYTPTRGVAMWVGDLQFPGTIIVLYDAAHMVLATFDLLDSGNGNGPAVYGFNAYLSDSPDIARIEISINSDDAVWFDDVQFGFGTVTAVPDGSDQPTTWSNVKGLYR
jgi:hypothetical protein